MRIELESFINSPRLFARKVWQQLFNFYKENDGNTDSLDSFLCDLRILEKYFDSTENFTLYWFSDFKSGYTDLTAFGSREGEVKIEYLPEDKFIAITFPGDDYE